MTEQREDPAERLYRGLLRLFPGPFRREFEAPMIDVFRLRRETASGISGRARLALHLASDLLRSLAREWAEVYRRRGRAFRPAHPSLPFADFLRDLRHALRSLRREPAAPLLAVLTLALGLAASVVIFAVVNGALLRPLPYPEAERIVRLWANHPEDGIERFSFTKIEFRTYVEENRTFDAIGGDFPLDLTLTSGDGEPERVEAAFVTPGFLEVFGAPPALGRSFTFDDIDAEDPRVALLSHRLWERGFGSDPGVVGEAIRLDDRSFTVLGVLPETYRHPEADPDVLIPYTFGTERWVGRWLWLWARLRPGVGLEEAGADVAAMTGRIAEGQPRTRGYRMSLEPLAGLVLEDVRPGLYALLGAVLLLLVLGTLNAASLCLGRAAAAEHEVVVRTTVGAGRFQRIRQNVIESLSIGLAGGALGCALAWTAIPHLLAVSAKSLPRLIRVEIDTQVVLFALATSLVACLALAAVPLFYSAGLARRARPVQENVRSTLSPRSRRLLESLVVVETALAIALLVGAGLLLKSFHRLSSVPLGFEPSNVAVLSVSLPGARYPSDAQTLSFFARFRESLEAIPGTESAATTAYLPLSGRGALSDLNSESRLKDGPVDSIPALQRIVSPGYFRALHIPLLEGRTFDEPIPEGAPRQVVLGESLARMLFPGESAVERLVTSSSEPTPEDWRLVVGVVADVRYVELGSEVEPQFYEPHEEQAWRTMTVVARTRTPLQSFASRAREALGAIDPRVPLYGVTTLHDVTRRSAAGPRFHVLLLALFASLGLLLASGGVYGVLSFVTARRAGEISVRMALGASSAAVVLSVLGRGMTRVAAGAFGGVALAALAFRGLRSLLFGVSPQDPVTYLAAALVLCTASLAACYFPALRASRVDPVSVLRR